MAERKIILEVQNLTKYFDTPRGKLHAVDGVNFTIEAVSYTHLTLPTILRV